MYIWYLYNCSLVGGDTCICVVCACIVVTCVVCCVFACELCSSCECFCSMLNLFVVSEYYVYPQSSVKVCLWYSVYEWEGRNVHMCGMYV